MGNCLEACKIRNGDHDVGTSLEASNGDECSIKDFYSVHLEDVLLKNPHESVEKMDREPVMVEEEKKIKKLRFCEEMEDMTKSCEKSKKKSACNTTSNVRKRDGLRVTFVLRKDEAATLIRLMQEQDEGGGKTLEALIEKLIGAPCSKPNYAEDVWRPVLPTIPEDESMD